MWFNFIGNNHYLYPLSFPSLPLTTAPCFLAGDLLHLHHPSALQHQEPRVALAEGGRVEGWTGKLLLPSASARWHLFLLQVERGLIRTSVIHSCPLAAGARSGFLSSSSAGHQHSQDYVLKTGTSNQAFRALVWGRPAFFSEKRMPVTAEAVFFFSC